VYNSGGTLTYYSSNFDVLNNAAFVNSGTWLIQGTPIQTSATATVVNLGGALALVSLYTGQYVSWTGTGTTIGNVFNVGEFRISTPGTNVKFGTSPVTGTGNFYNSGLLTFGYSGTSSTPKLANIVFNTIMPQLNGQFGIVYNTGSVGPDSSHPVTMITWQASSIWNGTINPTLCQIGSPSQLTAVESWCLSLSPGSGVGVIVGSATCTSPVIPAGNALLGVVPSWFPATWLANPSTCPSTPPSSGTSGTPTPSSGSSSTPTPNTPSPTPSPKTSSSPFLTENVALFFSVFGLFVLFLGY